MIFPPTLLCVYDDIAEILGLVIVVRYRDLLLIHFWERNKTKKKNQFEFFFRSQILTAGYNFIVEEGLQHNFAFLGLCGTAGYGRVVEETQFRCDISPIYLLFPFGIDFFRHCLQV
jgi:hypothetical protein